MEGTRAALAGMVGVLGCGLAALASAHAANGNAIVIGDSLGVDFAQVSHLQNFAQISVHIRGPRALEQIRRAPANVTAFVLLGTNDANGSIARLDKSIDDILGAAEKKHMRLIWVGPPCVHQSWDTRARQLDEILAAKLPPRGVTYVPMRDPAFCNGGMHASDGVHLKTKGSVYMWDKARRIAGFGGDGATATAIASRNAPATEVTGTAGGRPDPIANLVRTAAAQPVAIPPAASPPASTSQVQLASVPADRDDEPKIYVLRVKRGHAATKAN